MRENSHLNFADKAFESSLKWGQDTLAKALGPEKALVMQGMMREKWAQIRHTYPCLVTPYSRILMLGAVFALPLYLALGREMEEEKALAICQAHVEACAEAFAAEKIPKIFFFAFKIPLLHVAATRLNLLAEKLGNDSNGWLYKIMPKQPGMLIGYDVTRCGLHKYFTEMGVPELTAGAICSYDETMTRKHFPKGTRLVRTRLLSKNQPCCDFRYYSK
ncbi:MAG: L-2-amino-thiazoline-4-carboxylic acid hydrolase [Desulfatibacillaceae bacterium]|nr:L-2-amino-thiazoline-4-carboxylic acid hydrolase [Desulfatibacillaceae bacterium]